MRKRLYLIPLAAMLVVLYFTIFGERGLLRIYHYHRERTELQKKAEELRTENERLRREIEALRSDRRYLERLARKNFNLVRPNEVIYQFPGEGTSAGEEPATTTPAPVKK